MEEENLNKCRCGKDGEELHSCPFLQEIHGDSDSLCNCCEECELQCCMDI